MKKFILMTIITVLFITAIGSVGSVSVAANTEEPSHGRHWWAKESFTVNNRKGVIKDSTDNLYATIITLKIPPKENSNSSKDVVSADTESADRR